MHYMYLLLRNILGHPCSNSIFSDISQMYSKASTVRYNKVNKRGSKVNVKYFYFPFGNGLFYPLRVTSQVFCSLVKPSNLWTQQRSPYSESKYSVELLHTDISVTAFHMQLRTYVAVSDVT